MSGKRQLYSLEFSDADWEELESLSFSPFEFAQGESLTRPQWFALAMIALGKASLIEAGEYAIGDGHDHEDAAWVEQLRSIAERILDKFQPGDGQI